MLLDHVTEAQMQAAQVLSGVTMVAFLAAPMFRHRAGAVRLIVAAVYLSGMLGFLVYIIW